MIILRWIDPLPIAKLFAIYNAFFGLFVSIFTFTTGQTQWIPDGLPTGIVAIFLLPILYAFGGFVGGWLLAMIYNTLSKRIKGIQIRGTE